MVPREVFSAATQGMSSPTKGVATPRAVSPHCLDPITQGEGEAMGSEAGDGVVWEEDKEVEEGGGEDG